MNSVLLWALTLVAGLVGRYLAGLFAGSCPAAPETWVCVHWINIATVGSAVMAALGYGTARTVVTAKAASRAALKAVPPAPEPEVEQVCAPDTLGDYDPHQGP